MESSNYQVAHDLWNSFRDEVMFKQRFFLNHPVLDKLVEIARGREVTIDPGKVYYRARIIDDAAARMSICWRSVIPLKPRRRIVNGIGIKRTSSVD